MWPRVLSNRDRANAFSSDAGAKQHGGGVVGGGWLEPCKRQSFDSRPSPRLPRQFSSSFEAGRAAPNSHGMRPRRPSAPFGLATQLIGREVLGKRGGYREVGAQSTEKLKHAARSLRLKGLRHDGQQDGKYSKQKVAYFWAGKRCTAMTLSQPVPNSNIRGECAPSGVLSCSNLQIMSNGACPLPHTSMDPWCTQNVSSSRFGPRLLDQRSLSAASGPNARRVIRKYPGHKFRGVCDLSTKVGGLEGGGGAWLVSRLIVSFVHSQKSLFGPQIVGWAQGMTLQTCTSASFVLAHYTVLETQFQQLAGPQRIG